TNHLTLTHTHTHQTSHRHTHTQTHTHTLTACHGVSAKHIQNNRTLRHTHSNHVIMPNMSGIMKIYLCKLFLYVYVCVCVFVCVCVCMLSVCNVAVLMTNSYCITEKMNLL